MKCRWCAQKPAVRGDIYCPRCCIKRIQHAAIAKVLRATKRGDLPVARTLQCVDCEKPASVYDHRDYTKPLEVVPVCRSCNMKRGPALHGNEEQIAGAA